MTPTIFNEHVRLATAMLHGHLYVEPVPSYMEHVTYHGHDFILHPPLSGILCVPFVLLGITNQTLISEGLGLVACLLVGLLTSSGWLALFFAFGTTFAYEATLGASWNFALVASTPFTLAALCEVTRNQRFAPHWDMEDRRVNYCRPWLVGLWAGLAALARYDLVLAFPVYLWATRDRRILWGALLWAAVYLWFNEARFGTLTDISIPLWFNHYDQYIPPAGRHGTFSLHYTPYALYTLFLMGPRLSRGFPWLRPQFLGQSILSLSPGFLTANISPWLMAAALCSIPALTVYASGFAQLGCRYYVQVYPFLIAAMAEKPLTRTSKALIVVSIISCSYFGIVARWWGLV